MLLHGWGDGRGLACDFRFAAQAPGLASRRALSIIYGLDRCISSSDLVGPAYAKDILYSARTVEAEEALRIGFIQRLGAGGGPRRPRTTICARGRTRHP